MGNIKNLRDTYYRILQEALLTENEERIAYYEGVLDGLNMAENEAEPKAVEIILEDKPVGNTSKVYHDTPIPQREADNDNSGES